MIKTTIWILTILSIYTFLRNFLLPYIQKKIILRRYIKLLETMAKKCPSFSEETKETIKQVVNHIKQESKKIKM
jgi:hypothetical protein